MSWPRQLEAAYVAERPACTQEAALAPQDPCSLQHVWEQQLIQWQSQSQSSDWSSHIFEGTTPSWAYILACSLLDWSSHWNR